MYCFFNLLLHHVSQSSCGKKRPVFLKKRFLCQYLKIKNKIMSTQIYFVSKQCSSGSVALWPMASYGEICTTLADAEAKFAETVAAGAKGSKFSLETQKVVLKNNQVVKFDGAPTVVKSATSS